MEELKNQTYSHSYEFDEINLDDDEIDLDLDDLLNDKEVDLDLDDPWMTLNIEMLLF